MIRAASLAPALVLALAAANGAAAAPAQSYVFTSGTCVNGQPFGAPQQTCQQMAGTPLEAGATLPLYVTALADGVPASRHPVKDTTVAMSFALACINPATDAGVKASFAGVQLPLCAAGGAQPASWSDPVSLVFAGGKPSAAVSAGLVYADVGKVQLWLREGGAAVAGSAAFVSKPAALAIVEVLRSGDRFANPQADTGAGFAFARVGEPFTIRAAALTTGGARAPNFGNEGVRVALDSQRGGDGAAQAAMVVPPALTGDFGAIVGGVFEGTAFSVGEAGIVAVTPRLVYGDPRLASGDYLGTGAPPAAPTNIGRFYPDHFDTAADAPLPCLPHMACPAGVKAAYARQPFDVTVKPMSAQGALLRNYNGVLARPVTLAAFSVAGGASADPAGGTLSNNTIAAVSMVPNTPITAKPVYDLPRRFSSTNPRARDWVVPTAVYLRAAADENIAGGGVVQVSSLRGSASVEGGAMLISGRLALDSPHGSELLKMPVRASAQYWATTLRWETSANDNISTVQSGGIAFSNCLKKLAPCNSQLLGVTQYQLLTLKDGMTTFWLKAPGAGNTGSAQFEMNTPGYLPSTTGRAVFGVYKSPLIYLREVY